MLPGSTNLDRAPTAPGRRFRVLVVDDEPSICQVIALHLEDEGHEVHTAPDGVRGLERFVGERWDLVLTDWVMPGMKGDELADAIKRINPKMPVVLVTGFADRLTQSGRQDSPFDLIVRKPFTRETLRAALNLVRT